MKVFTSSNITQFFNNENNLENNQELVNQEHRQIVFSLLIL
jgi:hypothetical protein